MLTNSLAVARVEKFGHVKLLAGKIREISGDRVINGMTIEPGCLSQLKWSFCAAEEEDSGPVFIHKYSGLSKKAENDVYKDRA